MTRYAAGWTTNNTKDKASVGFLNMKLSMDNQNRFLSQFNDMDTVPNLDGQLMIGKANFEHTRSQPIAMFAVQIKTLPQDYSNNNKRGEISDYKYSCDAGAFYTVIEKVTMDPVLLLMVDARKQKAYCRHLSVEMCVDSLKKGDQQSCTVYFNEEDSIDNLDSFFEKLLAIANNRSNETSELVLIKNESSDDVRKQLIESAIELNRLLDNEYRFVKESLFPHVKQFGLALNKSKKTLILKVFKIVENEQGDLVRNFEFEELPEGKKRSFFDVLGENDVMAFFRNTDNFDPSEVVEKFCQDQIERFCKKAYLPAHYLSDDILAEVAFFFLDTLSERYPALQDKDCGRACYKNDSLSISEIEKLWIATRDADLYYYDVLDIGVGGDGFTGTLIIDPLKKSSKEKDEAFLNQALSQPYGDLGYTLLLKGDFPYDFVKSVIDELSDRDIDTIARPWRRPEGDAAIEEFQSWPHQPQTYIWYTTNTFYQELEKLIRRTQSAYRFAIKGFSRGTSSPYELTGKYEFFLKETRDPQICILHKPGKKFETSWTYDPAPEEPFENEYDQSIRGYCRIDFCNAPLYSMLEYFLITQICKYHKIHCVVSIGEHVGGKFR